MSKPRIIVLLLLVGCLLSLLATGSLMFRHVNYKRSSMENSKAASAKMTVTATEDIGRIVRGVMTGADSVAADLSLGRSDHPKAFGRLTDLLKQNPVFYGVSITYSPYAYKKDQRLFGEYNYKRNGKLNYVRLDETYDYTLPEYEWYGEAVKQGSRWSEPYFDSGAGNTLMTTYSAVFFGADADGKKLPLGVVTVDISLDEIRGIVEALELGASGYGALVSRKGKYLYHPNTDYVLNQKTILDVAKEKKDQTRQKIWEMMNRGQGGVLDHVSTTTGQQSWLVIHPVPVTNWSLQNTFLVSDIEIDSVLLRRQQMNILAAADILLILLCWLSLRAYLGNEMRLWLTSILSALILAMSCGIIWHIFLSSFVSRKESGVAVLDRETLNRITKSYQSVCAVAHAEPPVFIPTGLLIDSIKFSGPNDVLLTGYVWQHYDDVIHAGLTRAFTIPEATDIHIEETMRHRENSHEIIRWHFQAVFRQRLAYAHYPLDRESVSMTLIHKDLNHNTVLVPDLGAYKITVPTTLPALDKDIFLPGWTIMESFFSLKAKGFPTDFGITRSVLKADFPLLHFNILIQRTFLNAFISNLTSLIIVSILLFCVVIIAGKVDTGRLISICVGMFFVIAIGHVSLRGQLAAQQIFYLEYFYFTIYVTMLWISINAIMCMPEYRENFKLLLYRDNLASKIAYWPTLMSILYAITLVVFY